MQADLRLCWSHIPHCWKSHVAAHIVQVQHNKQDVHLDFLQEINTLFSISFSFTKKDSSRSPILAAQLLSGRVLGSKGC